VQIRHHRKKILPVQRDTGKHINRNKGDKNGCKSRKSYQDDFIENLKNAKFD